MSLHLKGVWSRVGVGMLLAEGSAILRILAFPPYNLWPLIWIGFVPMMVAQFRVLPPKISSLRRPLPSAAGWAAT